MYWPVLIHNCSLLIILCGLVTIGQTTDAEDTILDGRNGPNAAPKSPPPTGHSPPGSSSGHQPHPPQYAQYVQQQAQQHAQQYAQQQQAKPLPTTTTTIYHHGSGAHNIESRNSFAMLRDAMSEAVSHELSKWSVDNRSILFIIARFCVCFFLFCYSILFYFKLLYLFIFFFMFVIPTQFNGNISFWSGV